MKINIIPAGIYDANCYILIDEVTNEAAVIDPGGDAQMLINNIKASQAEVKMILLTHGHADHTGAVSELRNEFGCSVYINEKDSELIDKNVPIYGNKDENGDKFLNEGDIIKFGNYEIKCIETPGHTPGGMCFLIGNTIFTGDTLFHRSIGRTDFKGGDFGAIISSIKNKLLTLPEDTIVYPGHGPKSSIGFERNNNPFL
ncbi:MBL fold metallo-hydrolase [Clostridium sp.]|jgi:glyoxylase-like metal-dependent hydrolase (beta-lactamase superfamily II)|uniref:MBL fold metallo-hydrolase n=1 Tax=Clostridium sp. TaxID=1506 RepID=UPI00259041CD|nr:MBL fold metallo-hydrolase [Clostridium sp.]MDF2504208.1 Zn-dependent hydrolase, glyoxylase [Clostridium sp.]